MAESVTQARPPGGGHRWWGNIRSAWLGIRWPLVVGLGVLAILLGYLGFDTHLDARGVERSFGDKLYLSLQLVGLQSGNVGPPVPWQLQIARFLAPILAVYAAASAIVAVFREQIAAARVRWRARGHVVVCGLARTGHLLAHGFREFGYRVVVIENDPAHPARPDLRDDGIVVLTGDPSDREQLRRARADRARYLFAVTDEDGVNSEIALHARDLNEGRRGSPLTCFAQVLDIDLAELLGNELATRSSDGFRLEMFNPSERGASVLLNEHPPFDQQGGTPLGKPHLLVVGLGEMGTRLVLHAAGRWKAAPGTTEEPLPITVVDDDAERHVSELLLRHPELERVCTFRTHTLTIESSSFERGDFLDGSAERPPTTVYICLGNDAVGLAAALRLRRQLRRRGHGRVPVIVRTKELRGLGSLVSGPETRDLHVFGLLDLTCRPDIVTGGRIETLARAIHEEYVRKQVDEGRTARDNPTLLAWEALPEHLRDSNRAQADDIVRKLRSSGLTIEPLADGPIDDFAFPPDRLEELARQEHQRWWDERDAEGWTYGPEKDVERKKTPYVVPWEQLSEEIKQLDRDVVLSIPAVLAKAGFRVAPMVDAQSNSRS